MNPDKREISMDKAMVNSGENSGHRDLRPRNTNAVRWRGAVLKRTKRIPSKS